MTETAAPLREGTAPPRTYRFDDLRLQVDQRLQLDVSGKAVAEHIHARLLGYLKGTTLIVRLPTTPAGGIGLSEGNEVTVRGFTGRIAFSFTSLVEKIRHVPYIYCHLRFPAEIRGAEIRKAMRVQVVIPARVVNPRLGGEGGMAAAIGDISSAGAMLTSPTNLGSVGDSVTLSFRFWIPPNDYEVNLNIAGILQVITPLEQNEGATGLRYGIKFKGMRSTEAILLQTLVYQRLLEDG
jgi:hypothetical protein